MMMMMMMMIMTAESMNALHRLARGCFHLLDKFLKLFRDFMEEILDSSLDIVNFRDDNFFSLEIPMQNITHN